MRHEERMPGIPPGYRIACQGDRHDVLCNGTNHIFTTGGVGKPAPDVRLRVRDDKPCDCAQFTASKKEATCDS